LQSSGDAFVDEVKALFEGPRMYPPLGLSPRGSEVQAAAGAATGDPDELPWDLLLGRSEGASLRGEGGAA